MWRDRVLQSHFKTNAIKFGGVTEEEIQRISEAWGEFATTQDAWYTVVNGEMIARKSK
jgi:hypothetical protein